MRFLADESCDFAVVRALRAAGHDVKAVVETHRGATDESVIALALSAVRLRQWRFRFMIDIPRCQASP